jgi:fluoride exporter
MSGALLWCGVAVIGGLGAVARFELDGLVQGRLDTEFPFGTLVVNGLGSLLLGLLVGLGVTDDALLLAGVAALGSFTTFSTWMLETHRLAEDGDGALALVNVLGSIAIDLVAAGTGWALGALV